MSEDRCPLTELPKTGCSHCRGHDDPITRQLGGEQLTEADIGPRFEAAYGGSCGNCGSRIHAGDVIARLLDGGGWACPGCLP